MKTYTVEVNVGYGPEVYEVYSGSEEDAIQEALARADCDEPHSVKILDVS